MDSKSLSVFPRRICADFIFTHPSLEIITFRNPHLEGFGTMSLDCYKSVSPLKVLLLFNYEYEGPFGNTSHNLAKIIKTAECLEEFVLWHTFMSFVIEGDKAEIIKKWMKDMQPAHKTIKRLVMAETIYSSALQAYFSRLNMTA